MGDVFLAFYMDRWFPWATSSLWPSAFRNIVAKRVEIVLEVKCYGKSSCSFCENERQKTTEGIQRTHHLLTYGVAMDQNVYKQVGKHVTQPKVKDADGHWFYVKLDPYYVNHTKLKHFLDAQMKKPYNLRGYRHNFISWSKTGAQRGEPRSEWVNQPSWFCSELATAACLYAQEKDDRLGQLNAVDPCKTTPCQLLQMVRPDTLERNKEEWHHLPDKRLLRSTNH